MAMKINEFLFHNDVNYRNLVEERERENWQPPIDDYTALSNIELRRYSNGHWNVKYFSHQAPINFAGNINWDKKATTFEVGYLFEEIQAEFVISKDTRQITRDSIVEDMKGKTLWQVLWIDEVRYTDKDTKVLIPDCAIVIYNNQAVWKTYAEFKGYGHQYVLPKNITMLL
jgi:hypothetical protein